MNTRKKASFMRNAATAVALAGGGILLSMLGILFSSDSNGSIGAFIILLPVPLALLLISYLLFRKAKKIEKSSTEEMPSTYQTIGMEMNDEAENNRIDWNDDSGEIHTVIHQYNQTTEDGWQNNRAVYGSNYTTTDNQQIKGIQTGFVYQTDDYRKVLPAYIIGTIVLIAVSIITLILIPIIGIFVSIFSIVWIIGLWAKAPFKKWRNQEKKLKEDGEISNR